jgi:CheY-like chemotaxis protein
MNASASNPSPLSPLAPAVAQLAAARVAPEVLAKVGEAYAAALWGLQQQLGGVSADTPAGVAALDAARAELARLEHLGVQIQGVARVLAGEGRVDAEPFDLAAAARQALEARRAQAQRRGIRLEGPTEPMPVEAVAGVVEQLLEMALDVALRLGERFAVGAGMQGQPPRPMLTLHVERPAGTAPDDAEFDDLRWLLFGTLARAAGFVPQRVAVGSVVVLMLGFPLAAGAADPALRSPALLPRTPVASGRRVLLVEPHEPTRVLAHRLMHEVGMAVDAATSVSQARMLVGEAAPDVLVIGQPSDAGDAAAFVDLLRTRQPRLRVLELVDDDDAFAFSLPGSGRPGRVGRGTLARTLVSAISEEVDAAWLGAGS